MSSPVPVNIVSGPLGVGKTTAINHLLAQRPPGERWAVLVNEYGLVGLDGALLASHQPAVQSLIKEVAGGCICCSAGPVFEVSVIQMLRRRPDRLIIEPTGLAALSGILDTLAKEGIRKAIDLRTIICLLNPATLARDAGRDEVRDQIEAADVLLAGRADAASAQAIDDFQTWARALFPPKRHIAPVAHGRLPVRLLDLVCDRPQRTAGDDRPGEAHQHVHTIDQGVERNDESHAAQVSKSVPIVLQHHCAAGVTTIGWILFEGLVFDAERVMHWIESLARRPGIRRVKAVLRTDRGWMSLNLADAEAGEIRTCAYRRDSRLELIIERHDPPPLAALDEGLRGCLLTAAAKTVTISPASHGHAHSLSPATAPGTHPEHGSR